MSIAFHPARVAPRSAREPRHAGGIEQADAPAVKPIFDPATHAPPQSHIYVLSCRIFPDIGSSYIAPPATRSAMISTSSQRASNLCICFVTFDLLNAGAKKKPISRKFRKGGLFRLAPGITVTVHFSSYLLDRGGPPPSRFALRTREAMP